MVEQRGVAQVTITDPQVMRALAHPARLAILEYLASTGSTATATECAQVCGLSPSATSYHLRALARWGLVREAPGRGDGRERLWRSATVGFGVDVGPAATPAARAAEQALISSALARADERVQRWAVRAGDEPPEWHAAAQLTEIVLVVTAEELVAINRKVQDLVDPYKRRSRVPPPPDARVVSLQYRAFPTD